MAAGATLIALSLVACDSDGTTTDATDATNPVAAVALPPDSQDCVSDDQAPVSWDQARNPVISLPDQALKNETVTVIDGRWYLITSYRFEDERVGSVLFESDGLATWTQREARLPDDNSPNLTREGGGNYVLTFQSVDTGGATRLYYRTSPDLVTWSDRRPLFPDAFPGQRLIDPGLAHTANGLFLMFKRGERDGPQFSEVAWSESGDLDGPWELLGEPDTKPLEDFQFLVIDGAWHVLGTEIPIVHVPVLYRLVGDPADPESWLHWEEVGRFEIPEESWNEGATPGITHETANASFLCDARAADGYFYLFYGGSTELDTFAGRGHAKIGVARSRDLQTWEVPPG
ncbi:MAG: hypothetical protein ACRDWD_10270 [Acidimicrobiia bacterium]